MSSSFFDSLEPFCTNQIVAAMKSENCRNSDCRSPAPHHRSWASPGSPTRRPSAGRALPARRCGRAAPQTTGPPGSPGRSSGRRARARCPARSVSLLRQPHGNEEEMPHEQQGVEDEHRAHTEGCSPPNGAVLRQLPHQLGRAAFRPTTQGTVSNRRRRTPTDERVEETALR